MHNSSNLTVQSILSRRQNFGFFEINYKGQILQKEWEIRQGSKGRQLGFRKIAANGLK